MIILTIMFGALFIIVEKEFAEAGYPNDFPSQFSLLYGMAYSAFTACLLLIHY